MNALLHPSLVLRTVMSFWAILQSPLIHGGDIRQNDAQDWAVLLNEGVLAMQVCRNPRRAAPRQCIGRIFMPHVCVSGGCACVCVWWVMLYARRRLLTATAW
jgi:hypothetical protein